MLTFKRFAAVALLGFSVGASAHNDTIALTQKSATKWLASFDSSEMSWNNNNNPILDNDPDRITFTGLTAGAYRVSLIGGEADSNGWANSINFTSIKLGGQNVMFNDTAFGIRNAFLTVSSATPLTLSLNGTRLSNDASYWGSISVTAVPEPEAAAMFMVGLGLIGAISKRRRA